MTQHSKLKAMCDEIDFDYGKNTSICYSADSKMYVKGIDMHQSFIIVDVREIIFTQEFMDKYRQGLLDLGCQEPGYEYYMMQLVLFHTDNPVDYLYDLLFNPKNKG